MSGRTFTHPAVLRAVEAGEPWADPELDPRRINWADRLAHAAIPFKIVDGRPLNPHGPTGIRYGRNELGHWGECQCADALVFVTNTSGIRWALMVERGDGHGWAVPGGVCEPGEEPLATAVRELAEETGLAVPARRMWRVTKPRYVPDPRASDEAWMVTVLCIANLGAVDHLPRVAGADDANRAAWVPTDSFRSLEKHLTDVYQGRVFAAHVDMLRGAL